MHRQPTEAMNGLAIVGEFLVVYQFENYGKDGQARLA